MNQNVDLVTMVCPTEFEVLLKIEDSNASMALNQRLQTSKFCQVSADMIEVDAIDHRNPGDRVTRISALEEQGKVKSLQICEN